MKTTVLIYVLVVLIVSLTIPSLVSASTLPNRPRATDTVNQFGPAILLSDAGWSDPTVGEWDPFTKTAKLTEDMNNITIKIISDGIVLDGNGHTLTGNNDEIGVWVNYRNGVTVKNLTIRQFGTGIWLQSSNNSTIINNSLLNNPYSGIYLLDAEGNSIIGNTFSYNSNGIITYRSIRNTLTGNTFSKNSTGISVDMTLSFTIVGNEIVSNGSGIYLGHGGDHTVRNNTISRNRVGIDIVWSGAGANKVFNNNFIFNLTQANVSTISGHIFNLDAPIGGNFWNDWIWPDDDRDGFVDNPYIFSGGRDSLPWALPNGWETSSAPPRTTVIGGGWIDSPPGAYIADPTLEGKATFGFVCSNQKDTEIPAGHLKFHFKDAGLVFSSTDFESFGRFELSGIDGDWVQLQGTGTINGAGDYSFRVVATDVQRERGAFTVDKFHIEIWDPRNLKTIYNVKLAANGGAAVYAGNIEIHTK